MMLPAKSPASLAAVLAAGVTLGAFIPHAMALAGTNGLTLNGLTANGVALNGKPFDFSAVSVQDVQFPAVGSK